MNKRKRPDWDEYFMFQAFWAATRSSCLKLQTGVVIAKNKRVIATGYNGAPPSIENCLKKGCRKDEIGVDFEKKGTGNCRGTHAEINAITYAKQDLNGASLYTVFYPCSDCAKHIIGAGISEVIYFFDYKGEGKLVEELFREGPISLKKFELKDPNYYFNMIKGVLSQTKE